VERRTIFAPLSGIVALVIKEPGEFVAPTDPYILKLVQLDQLLATFSVQSDVAAQFQVGQRARVALGGDVVEGSIESVAPIIDAESDTVRINVRIDNAAGKFRSGERCSLILAD
jgi:multidrug efflux pump subunit AcrA (membrane-fusion protein)